MQGPIRDIMSEYVSTLGNIIRDHAGTTGNIGTFGNIGAIIQDYVGTVTHIGT